MPENFRKVFNERITATSMQYLHLYLMSKKDFYSYNCRISWKILHQQYKQLYLQPLCSHHSTFSVSVLHFYLKSSLMISHPWKSEPCHHFFFKITVVSVCFSSCVQLMHNYVFNTICYFPFILYCCQMYICPVICVFLVCIYYLSNCFPHCTALCQSSLKMCSKNKGTPTI